LAGTSIFRIGLLTFFIGWSPSSTSSALRTA
jgi:hypothetical protein